MVGYNPSVGVCMSCPRKKCNTPRSLVVRRTVPYWVKKPDSRHPLAYSSTQPYPWYLKSTTPTQNASNLPPLEHHPGVLTSMAGLRYPIRPEVHHKKGLSTPVEHLVDSEAYTGRYYPLDQANHAPSPLKPELNATASLTPVYATVDPSADSTYVLYAYFNFPPNRLHQA